MTNKKYKEIFNLTPFMTLFFVAQCSFSTVKEREAKIETRFLETVKKSKHSKSATLLVHSDKLNLHVSSATGFVESRTVKIATAKNQPFHIASIGKIFTTVLLFQLIESGKLAESDSVQKILGDAILKDLFVINGKDYSGQVTINHLLTHTSGIADYFESVDKKDKSVLDEIKKDPNRFWTPADLLDFTRKNQKAISLPGKEFHYSDSGFILLGLIIEKISKKSFESVLTEKIFKPLGMKYSYMYLRSEPLDVQKVPISTMMLEDINVTNYKSISADWSGGGIISTTEDLLLFQIALLKGKLISEQSYHSLKGNQIFMDGIRYGKGFMTVKFGEMSAFMPNAPDLNGHSGLLGTQLFYSPDYDTHIVLNLGSTDDVGDSFELMFWLLQDLKEIQKLKQSTEKK